ncbi:hypothetical protein GCM10008915_70750 [Bifidobacterium pullorum subsp. gallinarum]
MNVTELIRYIEPTQNNGMKFVRRNMEGSVFMLNLLRFRDIADYTSYPELTPNEPISGAEAFDRYIKHALPFLHESEGEIVFMGNDIGLRPLKILACSP